MRYFSAKNDNSGEHTSGEHVITGGGDSGDYSDYVPKTGEACIPDEFTLLHALNDEAAKDPPSHQYKVHLPKNLKPGQQCINLRI